MFCAKPVTFEFLNARAVTMNPIIDGYSSTTETRTGGVPENQSLVSCGVRLSKVSI